MNGLTLRYTATTTTAPLEGKPDAEPETSVGTLRVSLGQTEIIVDDGEQARHVDFERQCTTTLRHETRTARESALASLVHGRESGMASAVHVMEVLRAGGAAQDCAVWQAEAAYGLSWHFGGDVPGGEVERSEVDGQQSWAVGERELSRVIPVAAPPPIPAKGVRRLLSFAFCVHPRVGAALAAAGTLPEVLTTDDHFSLRHRVCRYELASIEAGALDFQAIREGYDRDPPADETLAQLGKRNEGKPPEFRLDDARAALGRGELVEAALAVFAHNWAFVANTGELVAAIFAGAGWLSPVKRIPSLLSPPDSPKAAAKKLAGLEELRRHSGRYGHALDVLIGEVHVMRGEVDQAAAAFSRALMKDPELAATWVSLGRAYAEQLRFEDAWDCFTLADQLCPQHPVVGDIHQLGAGLRARQMHMF